MKKIYEFCIPKKMQLNIKGRTAFILIPILFVSVFLLNMQGRGDEHKRGSFEEKGLQPNFPIEGRIVFQSNFDGDNEIYLISDTKITKLTDNSWDDEYPMWSPDGNKISFMANPKGNYDIFIMNPDGSEITSITSFSSDEKTHSWFPDGKSIAFTRQIKKFLGRKLGLFRVDIDTKNTKKIIPRYAKNHAIPHVSPTAPLITFTGKRMFGWEVAVYDMRKNEVKFLDEGGKSCRSRFSKDGKKLVYVSTRADKKGEIWVMNPDGGRKTRLMERSETYDYFPCWSPDGKYIAFNSSYQGDHNGDWNLCILEVTSRKIFLLFDSPGNDVFPDWH
jgi:Tol biopolymer transport system component